LTSLFAIPGVTINATVFTALSLRLSLRAISPLPSGAGRPSEMCQEHMKATMFTNIMETSPAVKHQWHVMAPQQYLMCNMNFNRSLPLFSTD